jgi:hypothetical protein
MTKRKQSSSFPDPYGTKAYRKRQRDFLRACLEGLDPEERRLAVALFDVEENLSDTYRNYLEWDPAEFQKIVRYLLRVERPEGLFHGLRSDPETVNGGEFDATDRKILGIGPTPKARSARKAPSGRPRAG